MGRVVRAPLVPPRPPAREASDAGEPGAGAPGAEPPPVSRDHPRPSPFPRPSSPGAEPDRAGPAGGTAPATGAENDGAARTRRPAPRIPAPPRRPSTSGNGAARTSPPDTGPPPGGDGTSARAPRARPVPMVPPPPRPPGAPADTDRPPRGHRVGVPVDAEQPGHGRAAAESAESTGTERSGRERSTHESPPHPSGSTSPRSPTPSRSPTPPRPATPRPTGTRPAAERADTPPPERADTPPPERNGTPAGDGRARAPRVPTPSGRNDAGPHGAAAPRGDVPATATPAHTASDPAVARGTRVPGPQQARAASAVGVAPARAPSGIDGSAFRGTPFPVPAGTVGAAHAAAPVPITRRAPRPARNGPWREVRAAFRRRRRPTLLVALLAAGVATGLALLFPPGVVATTSLQVASVGTADPAPATSRALAAASTTAFTERTAALSGSTPAEISSRVAVGSPAPGAVEVQVSGADAASATAVATDVVAALRERIAALDAAVTAAGTDPLRAELDRSTLADGAPGTRSDTTGADPVTEQLGRTLAERTGQATVVVPGPEPVVTPEVPTAVWATGAAVLGALAVLLVVGVGVPARRRARGLLPEADPVGALREELDVPVIAPGHAPDAVPVLADAYRATLRGIEVVTVVQLTGEPACDVAGELVKAATLTGDERAYVDLTPGAEPVVPEDGVPVIRALRTPRVLHEDLCALRDGGPTVLAVQTAGTRPEDVSNLAAALRAVGAPPVLCLVWTGKLPRDPARVPLPADARVRSVA